MKIGLIGLGAIGSFLVSECYEHEWLVFDQDGAKVRQTLQSRDIKNARFMESFPDLLAQKPDLVVEAASQAAVPQMVEALHVCDVLLMSVGALTDDDLLARLSSAAQHNGHRLLIPSGAVGGLDVLQSCRPREVVLETRKSPQSLGRDDVKETVVFDGPALEACRKFPKNVNVAATLSLAGIGFDYTKVRIISDPSALQNSHTVRIRGDAGNYVFTFQNEPFKENLATSLLAAYSALHAVRKLDDAIQIG